MEAADLLLGHFDKIAGPGEPAFYPVSEDRPRIAVAVYSDSPEPAVFTAFTVGLSHSHPPEGAHRELVIRMRAGDDISCALACGFIADQLRERAAFNCGDTIDFHEAISAASAMSAFVVTHPMFLAPHDTTVDVGVREVELVQMVPIFEAERHWIRRGGNLQEFFGEHSEAEWINPLRQSIR
jgi:hypothetical protein